MSQRIVLSIEKTKGGLAFAADAWIGDFSDFEDLAKNSQVLWGDHIRIWADSHYLPLVDEFILTCENERWPNVISRHDIVPI